MNYMTIVGPQAFCQGFQKVLWHPVRDGWRVLVKFWPRTQQAMLIS